MDASAMERLGIMLPLDFGGHLRLHRYNFLLQQRKQLLKVKEHTVVCKEDRMTTLAILFIMFVLLDVAALRWGYDSRDGINDTEWRRRQEWALSHLMHHD